MKAAVVNGVGRGFEVMDVDISAPTGREVLVDIRASGLCQTDLSIASYGMGYPMPAVLGHEIAGVVAATGPGVTSLAVGDHVVASLVQACGTCATCLSGKPFRCPRGATLNRSGDEAPRLSRNGESITPLMGLGGFAEQALIHENQLVHVPHEIPFAQASLIGCGVATGAGAVLNTAGVQAGDSVVIVGVGGVGLSVVSGARLAGASRIIAIDINDAKLEKARLFGATDVINSTAVDATAVVRDLTGDGADHVFDIVGATKVVQESLAMTAIGGGLYLVGVAGPDASVTVSVVSSVLRQTKVEGVTYGSSNFKRDIPMYAELYLQGRLNLDDLLTKEISLGEIAEGYAALKDPLMTRTVITSF